MLVNLSRGAGLSTYRLRKTLQNYNELLAFAKSGHRNLPYRQRKSR